MIQYLIVSNRGIFRRNDSTVQGFSTRATRWLSQLKTPCWRWDVSFKPGYAWRVSHEMLATPGAGRRKSWTTGLRLTVRLVQYPRKTRHVLVVRPKWNFLWTTVCPFRYLTDNDSLLLQLHYTRSSCHKSNYTALGTALGVPNAVYPSPTETNVYLHTKRSSAANIQHQQCTAAHRINDDSQWQLVTPTPTPYSVHRSDWPRNLTVQEPSPPERVLMMTSQCPREVPESRTILLGLCHSAVRVLSQSPIITPGGTWREGWSACSVMMLDVT